ncbi:hypothetical protein JOE38_002145 [Clavibacter michiganensis]|nr:hypothetical protein [Clavibacter michiganensis]
MPGAPARPAHGTRPPLQLVTRPPLHLGRGEAGRDAHAATARRPVRLSPMVSRLPTLLPGVRAEGRCGVATDTPPSGSTRSGCAVSAGRDVAGPVEPARDPLVEQEPHRLRTVHGAELADCQTHRRGWSCLRRAAGCPVPHAAPPRSSRRTRPAISAATHDLGDCRHGVSEVRHADAAGMRVAGATVTSASRTPCGARSSPSPSTECGTAQPSRCTSTTGRARLSIAERVAGRPGYGEATSASACGDPVPRGSSSRSCRERVLPLILAAARRRNRLAGPDPARQCPRGRPAGSRGFTTPQIRELAGCGARPRRTRLGA